MTRKLVVCRNAVQLDARVQRSWSVRNAAGFGWSLWYEITPTLYAPIYDGFYTKREAVIFQRRSAVTSDVRAMVNLIARNKSPRHGWLPSKALVRACKRRVVRIDPRKAVR